MKKQMRLKLVSILLACMLALLAGCFAGETTDESTSLAMGRFLEEELSLPEELLSIVMFTQDHEGNLVVLGNRTSELAAQHGLIEFGPWVLLKSTDDGNSWLDITPPSLAELDKAAVQAAALGTDGALYISSFYPVDSEESANSPAPGYTTAIYRESGKTIIPLPDEAYDVLGQMLPTADGRLILAQYEDVHVYNVQTGELLGAYDYSPASTSNGAILTHNERIAISQEDVIKEYNLSDGSEINTIVAAPKVTTTARLITTEPTYGDRVITVDQEQKAYYFCDASGLYRVLMNSPASERLIAGDQTSLNMPSMVPLRLFAMSSGAFLVYGQNGEGNPVLYRYRYNEHVPSVPDTELRVYSLEENPTIRQAMGEFQRVNPQLKVTYMVGVGEDGSVTIPDAARSLATEILAGKGPDVLVLDGLPIESYIQKGVLADLSEPLAEFFDSSDYFQNLLTAYRQQDSAVYAVPARFIVPVALGESDAVSLHEPDAILHWMQQQPGTRIQFLNELGFVEYFYASLYPTWFDGQGAVNQQALLQSLQTIESIYSMEGMAKKRHLYGGIYTMESIGANWANESIRVGWADLTGIMGINAIHSATQQRGTGAYETGFGLNISYPATVLGVTASSEQAEKAMELIRLTLQRDVQNMQFDDGLPVHKNALLTYVRGQDALQVAMNLGTDNLDNEFISFQMNWAPETYVESFLKGLEKTEPVHIDMTVKAIILSEIEKMVYESASIESTAAAIQKTIDLYLSEQR